MGILNNPKIITGVKPRKTPPTFRDGRFIKTEPLGEHNFPLSKYTDWDIYGYRKDPFTGMKRPYWLTKRLPTGRPLTARMVGLDGFFSVKPKKQVI